MGHLVRAINQIDADLAARLWSAIEDTKILRKVVAGVVKLAIERSSVAESLIQEAMLLAEDGNLNPKTGERLQRLAEKYDTASLRAFSRLEQGKITEEEATTKFAQARAVSAAVALMDEDAFDAACLAIYEAYHAYPEWDEVLELAHSILG